MANYQAARTVTITMLAHLDTTKAKSMARIEKKLADEVAEAARLNGDRIEVPVATWTCQVVGRTVGGDV